jgi:hypothetical protein
MKLEIRIIITILLFYMLAVAAGCGNSTPTTTSTTTFTTTHPSALNTSSSQSANGLSLSLSLDSAAYQPGQNITIVVDEKNTLSKTNNIPKSDNWAYDHFRKAPCDSVSPFGAAIFRGDYTVSNYSTATPLTIYDPHATLLCPTYAPIISYEFQPLSDTANVIADSKYNQYNNSWQFKYEVTIRGYWPDNDFNSKSILTIFEPGVYTIVAGDEWGAVVVVHFTVTK